MRIEFDTGNATELAAVSALIAVLRGDDTGVRITGGDATPMIDLVSESPDPAEAFAGGVAAEDAFGAGPTVAAAPVATAEAPASSTASPTSAPASASASADVDADGIPWDSRIHSTPATKKADGRWRSRRGVDDTTKATVTAELKQAMAAPAAPVVPVAQGGAPAPDMGAALEQARAHLTPEAPAAPLPPAPPVPVAAVPAPVTTPPAPPAPAATGPTDTALAPTAPAAAAAAHVSDFAGLMRQITALQSAGALTVQGTQEIAASLGLTGIRDLMHRADLIPSFAALLPAAS